MRKHVPTTCFSNTHSDYAEIAAIEAEIVVAVGGVDKLTELVPPMLRACIDDVIDAPSTGRIDYDELEKTEKTYLGTRVEIKLRALLGFPKGLLDFDINGKDVDVKFTAKNTWMIPREAIDHVCILTAADEDSGKCYLGLLKMKPAYLSSGENQDKKKSVSAEGFRHINWLINGAPYPRNFWRSVPADKRKAILTAPKGTARVARLFLELPNQPIHRSVVEAVAQQKDPMRRLRRNGGARDSLESENFEILSGKYDSITIKKLGLPECDNDSFISVRR